jgi:hypothetical protein
MYYRGDSIVGTLVYKYFQKDKNIGTLCGKVVKDLIIADYEFQSEGLQSIGHVVFKKVGGDFIEGYGASENKNGRDYLKNIDSLVFSNSIVLKNEDCQLR